MRGYTLMRNHRLFWSEAYTHQDGTSPRYIEIRTPHTDKSEIFKIGRRTYVGCTPSLPYKKKFVGQTSVQLRSYSILRSFVLLVTGRSAKALFLPSLSNNIATTRPLLASIANAEIRNLWIDCINQQSIWYWKFFFTLLAFFARSCKLYADVITSPQQTLTHVNR